ncbi:MAG: methyltransferase domain-containing protein [Syntrophobacteraceae bacterium]
MKRIIHSSKTKNIVEEFIKTEEQFKNSSFGDVIDSGLLGTQSKRKGWLRYRIWNRFSALFKPLAYSPYRYYERGGFLDGGAAMVYHVLQTLRFPLVINVKHRTIIESRSFNAGCPQLMPLQDDSIRFHDELAAEWEQKYTKASFRNRLNALLSLISGHDLREQKWLDAGCGSGIVSRILAQRGCTVTGVDRSRNMIEAANRLNREFQHVNKPVFERVRTIEILGYPDETFDGIICSSVLEYVDQPMKAVEEFYRVVKPGGLLIVSVPNRLSLLRNIEKLLYKICLNCFGVKFPAYLELSKHDFKHEDFRQALLHRGFKMMSSTGYGPYLPRFLAKTTFGSSMLILVAKKAVQPHLMTDEKAAL